MHSQRKGGARMQMPEPKFPFVCFNQCVKYSTATGRGWGMGVLGDPQSPPPTPWLLSVSQFLFRFLFLRLTCALKRIFCTLSSNRCILNAAALPVTSSFRATKDSVRLKSRRIPAATQLTCLLGIVMVAWILTWGMSDSWRDKAKAARPAASSPSSWHDPLSR